MALFLENLSLDLVAQTEKEFMGLIAYIAEKGNGIVGYTGNPYINYHYGGAQLVLTTKMNEEEKKLEVVGLDTHADSTSVWTVAISGVLSPDEGKVESAKRLLVRCNQDGMGMVVINVVNADVLPSFLEDDVYNFQMIAFPSSIDYYATEEDYYNSLEKDELGRTFGIDDGVVFPSGFMKNRDPENEDYGKNNWMDDYSLIRGTVKKLYYGKIEVNGQEFNGYVRCIIDTKFGELEINHSFDQVDETQQSNIKIGATVVAVCVLSADAAIYEYTDGVVKDEEHHLRLLRHVFVTGEAERLKYMLSDDAEYVSERSNMTYRGRREIIERLKYVHSEAEDTYYAHMATITEIEDNEGDLQYNPGKRCVVLASGEEDNYESIVFIDVNEKGLIARILITTEGRYRFNIERNTTDKNLFEDYEPAAGTSSHAILMRAMFFNFLDDVEDEEQYLEPDEYYAVDSLNAKKELEAWPKEIEKWNVTYMEQIFGRFFAKSMETAYIEEHQDNKKDFKLEEKINSRLEIAMKYGRQYCTDFMNYNNPQDEEFESELIKSLVLVQKIGRHAAKNYLEEE